MLLGVLVGLAYAGILRLIDEALPTGHIAHRLLDWTFPMVFGVALGVAIGAGRARAEKVRAEQLALERLQHRLEGSERERAIWVLASSLLHELRNPLHTLGLALEELDTRGGTDQSGALVAEARRAVERMNRRFRALGELAAQPHERAQRYDLVRLVRTTAEPFEAIARTNSARVRVSTPEALFVTGDPELTRSALENLLSNAVDAVRLSHGHDVWLELQGGESLAVVRVRDDGPGVPESLRAEVFQPLRSTKGPQNGLGLGLPIARGLARAQGGDVTLETGGPGACFALTLPLAPRRESEEGT
jgi:two-component system C4-dicarboxylate transport sensor histidine kinase DctB